jgi:hypothetical protein
MAPRGEGRLVPIPPRVRAIAPPALPVRIFGLALLLALALLVGAKPAAAKTPCWKQVVQDWFEDSTIDRTYPRYCYSDALKNVPNDVKDYSSFEEDIRSALQRVSRARSLSGTGSGASTQPEKPTQPQRRIGNADEVQPRPEYFKQAFDKLGPREADSMPVPLMIMAGLALLLVAAGAGGLITRHFRARRAGPPAT